MSNPYKDKIDTELTGQLKMIQSALEAKAADFPRPRQHPISVPLNLGTPDPKLKYINEKP